MRRSGPALAAALAAVLLAGCAPTPTPPGPTDTEVAQYRADQAQEWWRQSFGGPQPEVAVIATVPQKDWPETMVDCVADTGLTGLSLEGGNLFFDPRDGEDQALYRAYYICAQQYPYEITDPAQEGIYSEAQIRNLYGYFSQRLAPCLEFLGIPVDPAPSEEEFVSTFYGLLIWNPYSFVQPGMLTWDAIDHECPRPPEPFEFLHP